MSKASIMKIVLGVVAGLLLLYFYISSDRTPVYNWYPAYQIDSKEPYGCYLFNSLVKESVSTGKYIELDGPINKTLEAYEGSNATYIFIGANTYYSETDFSKLANFVYNGNTAYILTEGSPYEILNQLEIYSTIYFGSFYNEKANVEINNSDLPMISVEYVENWNEEKYYWAYADSISDDQIQILGRYDDEKFNYFKVEYGRGSLYIHLTPLAFTNFHLKEEKKLRYANEVLSNFKSERVYWDDFSHIPVEGAGLAQSPLSFILSQESLKWAWYLLLSTGIVYLIFYAKRKQRVIPVINKVKNTSVDFVKTIGSMYYHQEAHLKIVQHQHQLFLTYIHTKYGISIHHKEGSFLKKVSLKSGIAESELDMILKEAKRLELLGNITTKDLIAYNNLTENFYQNCK